MTAKDYPVTFGYGATTKPYSPSRPHLGEDRKMPLGTPIKINGKLVGVAGTTGNSTGVHTHTQRQDKDGRVINPRGGGFDVPQPTIVVAVGFNDSIGNFVRYRDGNGETWSQFHMDKPAIVSVGQQLIKGDEMVTFEDLQQMSQTVLGRKTPVTRQWYDSMPPERSMTFKQVHDLWASSQEANDFRFKAWDYDRLKNEPAGFKKVTKELFERA